MLEENDDLWVELRHMHIADVTRNVTVKMKKFKQDKNVDGGTNMRDLSQVHNATSEGITGYKMS